MLHGLSLTSHYQGQLKLGILPASPPKLAQHADLERETGRQMQMIKMNEVGDFPGGAVVENLPANAGDTGLRPGLGRSHMPRSN